MSLSLSLVTKLSILVLVFSVVFGPFLWSLTSPLSHGYVTTHHPASPHSPPSLLLTGQQRETFRREGVLVLRHVMPPSIMEQLGRASDDIVANRYNFDMSHVTCVAGQSTVTCLTSLVLQDSPL